MHIQPAHIYNMVDELHSIRQNNSRKLYRFCGW